MATTSIEEIRAVARHLGWGYSAIAVAVVAYCWWPWIKAVYWHADWLREKEVPGELRTNVYLGMGLLATAIGLAALLRIISRHRRLAAGGVQTQARVLKVGTSGLHGTRPVTFAFIVNGQQYTTTVDTPGDAIAGYTSQTRLPVLYDPANPNNCHVSSMADVPKTESWADAFSNSLRDTVGESLHKVGIVVLCLVSIGIVGGVVWLFSSEPRETFATYYIAIVGAWFFLIFLGHGALSYWTQKSTDPIFVHVRKDMMLAGLMAVITVIFIIFPIKGEFH